jgi:hypothetical protein
MNDQVGPLRPNNGPVLLLEPSFADAIAMIDNAAELSEQSRRHWMPGVLLGECRHVGEENIELDRPGDQEPERLSGLDDRQRPGAGCGLPGCYPPVDRRVLHVAAHVYSDERHHAPNEKWDGQPHACIVSVASTVGFSMGFG